MKKSVIFLIVIVALYLVPSLILEAVYGPSYYNIWEDENRWEPDGLGGWIAKGQPTTLPPIEPSVLVPLWLYYLPIFLPGIVLFLFLLTPLSKMLESRPVETAKDQSDESDATGSGDSLADK